MNKIIIDTFKIIPDKITFNIKIYENELMIKNDEIEILI